MSLRSHVIGIALAAASGQAAEAHVICTIIADAASQKILLQQGSCEQRVTPASTFKIAISLMGFDAGVLKDEHSPSLPYQNGYVDWGGATWRQAQDPTSWIKYSVVWFSQQVTRSLGMPRFQQYVRDFQYGNVDVSGDNGKDNGLDRAWISSSLKISPLEQVVFLEKIVNRQLPVNQHAFDITGKITEIAGAPDGWTIHAKTGTGFPRENGVADESHGYGWFVGWATTDQRTLVFARLIQDEQKGQRPAGLTARDDFMAELPDLLNSHAN